MNPTTRKILEEATRLSPTNRAELVEHIIESFDTEPDESIRVAWETEAARRLADYKKGKAAVIFEEEVFYRIERDGKK